MKEDPTLLSQHLLENKCLVDVFETFRNICLNHYKLDVAHFSTAPGLLA